MNLESLANELFLDLFEFFSIADLLHTFYGLNSRLNILLFDHFRVHGLDFRSVSKYNFDTICRQHLSSFINRITSLCLSDNYDTPGQINQFYAHGFTLRQFIQLQSLSLYHFHSQHTIDKIILDLSNLFHLTHLIFEQCYFLYDEMNALSFVNIIWSLPKLTYCYMKIQFKPQIYFPIPRVISSTIEHLSIYDVEPCFTKINHLFEQTPSLRHLSIHFHFNLFDEYQLPTVTSIMTLNLSFFSVAENILEKFLQKMPNLCQLKIDLPDMFMNGQAWEKMICNHLPKLESFRFRMNDELDSDNDKEQQQVDEILNSFRSQFWLDEHHWFVQCDWSPNNSKICLYTLPYAFDNFYVNCPILSKSTYLHDNEQWSYDCVHRLTYKTSLSEWSTLYRIQFFNIRDLCVYLPVDDHFWSIVRTFDQLISLDVLWNDDREKCEIQLQIFLNRASHLSLLRIRNWSSTISQMSLFQQNRTLSFSQLDLMWYNGWYNKEECVALSRSPLGNQCKVLLSDVKNRTSILDLVNTMNNLQALNIRCEDDKRNDRSSVSTKDEVVEWLRQCLPSTCTIIRDYHPMSCIRLWIR